MGNSRKLNELAATAICGNDISSSVLYVSALSIYFAGQYAWITLLIVVGVLYLYRKIYGEVVGALPLNGGAYNALLNTTSKSTASFAATLTILSYIATAVIGANEAIHYLHYSFSFLPLIISTIILLVFFALLAISGMKESSFVAIFLFLFHLLSLIILSLFIIYYLSQTGLGQFFSNYNLPPTNNGSIISAIFFGFAASMLGVSGFESSANFVEQQQEGVFPKTLKNMWIIVSIINPLIAIFALSLFTLPTLTSDAYQNTLLIQMGKLVGNNSLAFLISIDAFLVLSGSVLTSFIGVSGLFERITLDRILPQYFIKKNKRGSSYRIITMFLLLCISILLITKGNVKLLAGVYSISFLAVMSLFGIGNILLKIYRSKIPRPEIASWFSVFIAITLTITALIGNILMNRADSLPSNLSIFLIYFIPTIILISIMLNRIFILKLIIQFLQFIFEPIKKFVYKSNIAISNTINKINKQEFVFFTKGDSLSNLNKVMLYILENENTKRIKFVTVLPPGEIVSNELKQKIKFLDDEYTEITVDFRVLHGKFTPELIHKLSRERKIPVNFMFIGSPSYKFPYRIEELGGVRLII
ncbi:MAG: APC family permease [Candidatus Gracilibacteria bacterium]